jgi:hypothetical protein
MTKLGVTAENKEGTSDHTSETPLPKRAKQHSGSGGVESSSQSPNKRVVMEGVVSFCPFRPVGGNSPLRLQTNWIVFDDSFKRRALFWWWKTKTRKT